MTKFNLILFPILFAPFISVAQIQ